MQDSSTLVTVAMLSTMLQKKSKDYLDIISPFVLELLPKESGKEVDISTIISRLKDEYGFVDFPVHVMQKILNRYAKTKNGDYLDRSNGKYYVKNVYSYPRFDENREKIKEYQRSVMEKLQQYLRANTKYGGISLADTKTKFLSFLEHRGLAFANNIDSLQGITARDYDDFYVARFVLREHDEKSPTFSHIVEIVNGFFVYKSIYYFSRENVVSQTDKMNGAVVYLDTPLLIEALGYDTDEGKRAIYELIELVHQCGGEVRTFSHLVGEVRGILTAFKKTPGNRSRFSLQNLIQLNYSDTDIGRLISSLQINLKKIGIEIDDPIPFTEYEKLPINTTELSAAITECYKQYFEDERVDNDVHSIATICKKRENHYQASLLQFNAILVTPNYGLANTVTALYSKADPDSLEYAISDIDLTAILWLRSWDSKSTLPRDLLIENAYAACEPTRELLESFYEQVDRLKHEGRITEEEALILRTQPVSKQELTSVTGNDSKAVTPDLVIEIKQKYDDGIRRGVELQNEVDLQERDRRVAQEALLSQRMSLIAEANRKANQHANTVEKVVTWIIRIVLALVFLVGVAATIYLSINQGTPLDRACSIIVTIFAIIGIIDAFSSRKGIITKMINRIRNKAFERYQEKQMQEIDRTNPDPLDN